MCQAGREKQKGRWKTAEKGKEGASGEVRAFGVSLTGYRFYLHHLLVAWLWTSDSTSSRLSLLVYKLGILILSILLDCWGENEIFNLVRERWGIVSFRTKFGGDKLKITVAETRGCLFLFHLQVWCRQSKTGAKYAPQGPRLLLAPWSTIAAKAPPIIPTALTAGWR